MVVTCLMTKKAFDPDVTIASNQEEIMCLPSSYIEISSTDDRFRNDSAPKVSSNTSRDKIANDINQREISSDDCEDEISLIPNHKIVSGIDNKDNASSPGEADNCHDNNADGDYDKYDSHNDGDDNDEDDLKGDEFKNNVDIFRMINFEVPYIEFLVNVKIGGLDENQVSQRHLSCHQRLHVGKNKGNSIECMEYILNSFPAEGLKIIEHDMDERKAICDLCDFPETLTKWLVINKKNEAHSHAMQVLHQTLVKLG
ncbi:hypothetical protein BDK51DRAFT_33159 [Blyttiomyces helicus]|uniref:Uncharacterized protein n=1 Tax=Blyttiomyces helicus TaxID=388810 RepID=A0A4P9WQM3_9FUNG|nr:hypothetical protein BDK51DRAFT_33159 [Blyttiomyces helicus]|eukprot:RKO94118.1 hypothetical protein BDK51DRAFT_33159 [Blyttiomyces helicus]